MGDDLSDRYLRSLHGWQALSDDRGVSASDEVTALMADARTHDIASDEPLDRGVEGCALDVGKDQASAALPEDARRGETDTTRAPVITAPAPTNDSTAPPCVSQKGAVPPSTLH